MEYFWNGIGPTGQIIFNNFSFVAASLGAITWQVLLIYRAYVSFERVPFVINSVLAIILFFIDWLLIEGGVQYFAKSDEIGLLVNGFKDNICWYGVTYDVLTGLG